MVYTIQPISTNRPTEEELEQTRALEQWLRANNLIDSDEDMAKREEILIWLSDLVKRWVKRVAEGKGMSDVMIEDANANLYTFGSYRLGVHGPGDDIDAHCIGPKWCERNGDFFGENKWSLEHMLRQSTFVDKVQSVSESFVPVIKLRVQDIDIDLTYAQLAMPDVPLQFDLQDTSALRGMTEESVRSINGCRVTDKIVQLVPNKEPFYTALRYLKFWGKRRGIYSNVMGFLGGINFAIIVCFVAILYPNACASVLVHRFFTLLATWNWAVPIRLTEIEKIGDEQTDRLVWDPRENRKDSFSIFPIITPCYPANNSTYNVSECTKAVMMAEFVRGKELTDGKTKWDFDELAQKVPFFTAFSNFLQVTVSASSAEDFQTWSGFMGSKVRTLVNKIQGQLNCRPWPKEFVMPRELSQDGQFRSLWFIGLRKKPPVNHAAMQFQSDSKVDLRSHVSSFTMFCMGWEHIKLGMTVEVAAVKYSDLPDWVFEGGVRPAKPAASTASSVQSTAPPPTAAEPATIPPAISAAQPVPVPAADADSAAPPTASAVQPVPVPATAADATVAPAASHMQPVPVPATAAAAAATSIVQPAPTVAAVNGAGTGKSAPTDQVVLRPGEEDIRAANAAVAGARSASEGDLHAAASAAASPEAVADTPAAVAAESAPGSSTAGLPPQRPALQASENVSPGTKRRAGEDAIDEEISPSATKRAKHGQARDGVQPSLLVANGVTQANMHADDVVDDAS